MRKVGLSLCAAQICIGAKPFSGTEKAMTLERLRVTTYLLPGSMCHFSLSFRRTQPAASSRARSSSAAWNAVGAFSIKDRRSCIICKNILPVTIDFTPIIAYFTARGNSAL